MVVTKKWNPLESQSDFVEYGTTQNVEFPQIPDFNMWNHVEYSTFHKHNPKFHIFLKCVMKLFFKFFFQKIKKSSQYI